MRYFCTLSPNHNIQGENGVYQRWTTYTLKSKSVSEMHFPTIWRSKFTDIVSSKKKSILAVDKSAWIKACIYIYILICMYPCMCVYICMYLRMDGWLDGRING